LRNVGSIACDHEADLPRHTCSDGTDRRTATKPPASCSDVRQHWPRPAQIRHALAAPYQRGADRPMKGNLRAVQLFSGQHFLRSPDLAVNAPNDRQKVSISCRLDASVPAFSMRCTSRPSIAVAARKRVASGERLRLDCRRRRTRRAPFRSCVLYRSYELRAKSVSILRLEERAMAAVYGLHGQLATQSTPAQIRLV
jgi:hypothetical protein